MMTGPLFFSEWTIGENMEDSQKTTEQQKQIIKRLRRSCLFRISAFAAVITIFFTLIAGVGQIRTDAMSPALQEGDLVLFLRCARPSCGEMILYKAGERLEAGQVMETDVRSDTEDKEAAGGASPRGAFIMVMMDHRLEGGDPRRYETIPEGSVEGTVFAVLRRGERK